MNSQTNSHQQQRLIRYTFNYSYVPSKGEWVCSVLFPHHLNFTDDSCTLSPDEGHTCLTFWTFFLHLKRNASLEAELHDTLQHPSHTAGAALASCSRTLESSDLWPLRCITVTVSHCFLLLWSDSNKQGQLIPVSAVTTASAHINKWLMMCSSDEVMKVLKHLHPLFHALWYMEQQSQPQFSSVDFDLITWTVKKAGVEGKEQTSHALAYFYSHCEICCLWRPCYLCRRAGG